MESRLPDLLTRLRADSTLLLNSEEATRQGIILPILGKLGWDRDNVREVVPEYQIENGRLDYCLRVGHKNSVFIEVKRTSEDLERHQEQLLDYAFREGVPLAVLTNGLVWWLYLPLRGGSWDQRKFFTIDIEQQDVQAATHHFEKFLARGAVADGSAVRRAEEIHQSREKERLVRRTIPTAWKQLCEEPDELLLELFAEKVESLCGHRPEEAELAEFLGRVLVGGQEQGSLQRGGGQQQRPRPRRRPEKLPQKGVYTHRKPKAFTLFGQRHSVSTFKEILLRVAELVYSRHPSEFSRATQLRGRKRQYFSPDFRGMTSPEEIADSGIYAETNLSANNIIKRCRDLLRLFDYSPDELRIDTE